jgi:hypothetical protein
MMPRELQKGKNDGPHGCSMAVGGALHHDLSERRSQPFYGLLGLSTKGIVRCSSWIGRRARLDKRRRPCP